MFMVPMSRHPRHLGKNWQDFRLIRLAGTAWRRGEVKAAGARYAGRARVAGEDAGVPAPGQVQAGFDEIRKEAEEEREASGRMVDAGERQAREEGAPVRDEVEAKDGELSERLPAAGAPGPCGVRKGLSMILLVVPLCHAWARFASFASSDGAS